MKKLGKLACFTGLALAALVMFSADAEAGRRRAVVYAAPYYAPAKVKVRYAQPYYAPRYVQPYYAAPVYPRTSVYAGRRGVSVNVRGPVGVNVNVGRYRYGW